MTRERHIRSHSGPDGGTDGGTGGENERRGRHSAPHRPAGADGRRGDAQRRTLDVVEGWTVPVTELSGLGVRTDPRTGARQLLGVGDQDFEVLLGGPTTGWERRVVEVPDPFGPNRHGGGRSNWEAVAGDASGRVFVVPERHHHLLVLDQDLRFELAVALERPPSWRGGPGLESVLLLQRGHVLAAKQRDPVMLVEYAPQDDPPIGAGPLSLLGDAEHFDVARAADGLRAAATWKAGHALASINELAVGPGEQVHAVSSISRTVAVLAPLDPRDERADVVQILDADDPRLYAARGARLEGLVLDPQAGHFVAVDHHDLDLDALFRVELDAQPAG